MEREVTLYADGGCSGNGTPNSIGGWSYIITLGNSILAKNNGSVNFTTNNRMEVASVLSGLKWIIENGYKSYPIKVVSDSQYVINYLNFNKLEKLNSGKWLGRDGKQIPNFKFIYKLYKQLEEVKNVKAEKVKGHSGHYFNELCDSMVQGAIKARKNWNKNGK